MDTTRGLAIVALVAAAAAGARAQTVPVTLSATLTGPPAHEYRTGEAVAEADRAFAEEVARRFPSLVFSSNLARAARELGVNWAGGDLAAEPNDLIAFLIHAAGCPDPSALAAVVSVSSIADDAVAAWTKLASCLRESDTPFTHVGVGRVEDPTGVYHWRWVILLVERRFDLQPVPRETAPGEPLHLAFTLADGLRDPEVFTVSPSGATRRAGARMADGAWQAAAPIGDESGEYGVEIMASDEHGPHVLALFPVSAGAAPPRTWRGEPPPSERSIATVADAERYLRELTDRQRALNGRGPFVWDDALAAIARGHSEDMRDHDFMGHVSATSGDVGDRLHRAGYGYAFAAENIARSTSLWEAIASLMRSPGHRRNLLTTEATRAGIGVAVVPGERGGRTWIVTQMFVKPLAGETLSR
jgi:uncharacterized protein YkwD